MKLNLQYFGPLVGRADSLENIVMEAKSQLIGKDSDAAKIEGKCRRGQQRTRWLDGFTDSKNEFEQTPGDGEAQESQCTATHRVAKCQTK